MKLPAHLTDDAESGDQAKSGEEADRLQGAPRRCRHVMPALHRT